MKPGDPKPPWRRPRPAATKRKPLDAVRLALARRRATEAKRRYPNLVDNMWAARLGDEDVARLTQPARSDDPLI